MANNLANIQIIRWPERYFRAALRRLLFSNNRYSRKLLQGLACLERYFRSFLRRLFRNDIYGHKLLQWLTCYAHNGLYTYKPLSHKRLIKFNHNALWSAPASGSHWVRFIAEYLTYHPTQGYPCNRYDIPICMNRFPGLIHPLALVRRSLPFILYKNHDPFPLTEKSTLLLLVRDFREHLAHTTYKEEKVGMARRYIQLLDAYDSFPGTKMLIYYEDLISEPEREIHRIKNFLAASEVRYRDFMSRYDYYNDISKQGKKRQWHGSNSGTNTRFHQDSTSLEVMTEQLKPFYELLAKPEYQQVKPYIARYMR